MTSAFAVIAVATLASSAAASPSLQRGFITIEPANGQWLFTACGTRAAVALVDRTPGNSLTEVVAEVRKAMLDRARGVFVEFRGWADERKAVAQRFFRALGYVADCQSAPANIRSTARLWASGNEPSWRFDATRKRATLTVGSATLHFPASAFERANAGSYEGKTEAARLRFEIVEQPCLDTMAEAGFGAQAVVRLTQGGKTRTLKGCAARF